MAIVLVRLEASSMPPRQPGPRAVARRLRRRTGTWIDDFFFDRRLGVDTGGVMVLPEHDGDAEPYEALRWLVARRLIDNLDLGPDDVFLDAGCGKGRVVIRAALHTPATWIGGFDISPALIQVAEANIDTVRDRIRCDSVGLFVADVVDWRMSDDVTVVFASNPFSGDIFERFLAEIVASADRAPRRLRLVYAWPKCEEMIARNPRFRLTHSSGPSFIIPASRVYEIDQVPA